MKIALKGNYFELIPENGIDCAFIDYIEQADNIIVGGFDETEIGKIYQVRFLE